MSPRWIRILLIIGIAAIYGILCRIVFAIEPTEGFLAIVSISSVISDTSWTSRGNSGLSPHRP